MQRIELDADSKATDEQMQWARDCGLKTLRVALPNVITVDDEAGTITVGRYYETDMTGFPIVARGEDGELDVVTKPFTADLPSRPVPYPA